ncbi:hypothetical protein EG329_001775 [Mollisiaceae sp. DMI_Dod_QoI]|nr:hypothetical protein EG329_001775 [Helotiales sp. DMI_Dod_QoI]
MKLSVILPLVLLPAAALAAPLPLEEREASPSYASPPPAGGYGKYSSYGSYKEKRDEKREAGGYGTYSGYGSYAPPAGGYGKYASYGTYKRAIHDFVKSIWN